MSATFGKVHLEGKYWAVECETFVRARLKRVFPRMRQEAATKIHITATPENTRELEWFLMRYPMEVADAEKMSRMAEQHKTTEALITRILHGHIPPPHVELAEPARDYQATVPQLLMTKKGFILADDLGLGKTVSAIACMASQGMLPVVVVCPAHLPRQWRKMINRFLPALTTHIIKKGSVYDMTPKRKRSAQIELIAESSMPDVIITSYHKLRGWAAELEGKTPLVIFEEAQQLRSAGTEIYRACQKVGGGATYRLGLSATPIYNYGEEFYNVLDVLSPDSLGSRDEFLREWCAPAPGQKSRLKDSAEFGAYLRREGLMLRRTRADVGRELPPLEKIVHEIDADHTAIDKLLQSDAVALAQIVLGHNESYRGEKMQAAGEFDALMRQATGIAKAPFVAEFVKMLLDSGEPVVLFGWHRAVYEIWCERLAEFNPVLYTGTESPTQKDESIRAFLAGESKLLIMSLRSGAGVDGLQGFCRTVVFGEIDWSPGVHEQIEGVRNPDSSLVERIDTGENSLRKLARDFLSSRGIAVAQPAVPADLVVDPA